jgi:hypothetical protein
MNVHPVQWCPSDPNSSEYFLLSPTAHQSPSLLAKCTPSLLAKCTPAPNNIKRKVKLMQHILLLPFLPSVLPSTLGISTKGCWNVIPGVYTMADGTACKPPAGSPYANTTTTTTVAPSITATGTATASNPSGSGGISITVTGSGASANPTNKNAAESVTSSLFVGVAAALVAVAAAAL